MIGSVPLQYCTRLIWQGTGQCESMHGTALMLSALSLQEIGLLIEALAPDYNADRTPIN
jgi:hypothetical protein